MIYDKIRNIFQYFKNITNSLELIEAYKAVAWNAFEEKTVIVGEHKIITSEYQTIDPNYAESHNIYSDIQIMLEGSEYLETYSKDDIEISKPYNEAFDVTLYKLNEKPSTKVLLSPGYFVYYPPGTIHRPGMAVDNIKVVKKMVIKLKER